MSVGEIVPIVPRLWRGWDTPGYPVGAYIGHVVSVGDLSGGSNIIEFIFKNEQEAANGRFYNLEQVNLFQVTVLTAIGNMQVINFESLGAFAIGTRIWRYALESDGLISTAVDNYNSLPLPLFLGQSSTVFANECEVSFTTPNLNLAVFSVTIQGYVWESRAIQAEGGLRRPADALYGR